MVQTLCRPQSKKPSKAIVKSEVGKIHPVFWWSYHSAWLGNRFSPIFYRRWTRGVYSLTLKQFWILVMLKHFWKIRFGENASKVKNKHKNFFKKFNEKKRNFKKSSPFWLKISVRAKLSPTSTSAKYYFLLLKFKIFLKNLKIIKNLKKWNFFKFSLLL